MKISELERLQIGDKVFLTKKVKKFYNKEAFDLCTINGVITDKRNAMEFIKLKMIGLDYPYNITVLELSDDVGDGPGIRAKVEFLGGLTSNEYFSHKELVSND